MDFARQQRDPTRHVIGIAFVILIHILVIYALVTGLARKAVEVIKKPLNATVIEEIKPPPPPPPPPKKIEIPKVVQTPVQPYVPPPDIPVPVTPTEPVISAPTAVVPTEPVVIAPPAPVAPPAPPKAAIRKGITRLGGDDPVYPRPAIKAGIAKGRVLAHVMIDEKGNVSEVVIVTADPKRYFEQAVIDALRTWKFHAEGEKYVGEVEVNFTLKDE
jgi:protein TonB